MAHKKWFLLFIVIYSLFTSSTADTEPNDNYLSVNGKKFTSREKPYVLHFYNGEGVNVTCHKDSGSDNVMLNFDIKGTHRSTSWQTVNSVNMYLKLSIAHNTASFRCVSYNTHTLKQKNIITMTLIINKERRGILTFDVNGLILPRIKQDNDVYYYEYKYNDGERVAVAVVNDNNMYRDVRCKVEGPNIPETEHIKDNTNVSYFTHIEFMLNKINNGSTISCTVHQKTDSKLLHINIITTFLFYTPDHNPQIGGLAMSNILLQYSNAIGSNLIEYIIGSETLYLSCVSFDKSPTAWIYSPVDVISQPAVALRPFQLQIGHESAIVQCQVNSSGILTSLTLVRGTHRSQASSALSISNSKGSIWIIFFGVVVFIILVAAVSYLWIIYKKKILKQVSSNTVAYTERNSIENVCSTETKGQTLNIDPIYSDPVDCIKHSTNTNEHTNQSVQNDEPSHASKQNNRPTHASKQNNRSTHASKQNNEPTNASRQNNEPYYASVQQLKDNVPVQTANPNNKGQFKKGHKDEPCNVDLKDSDKSYSRKNKINNENMERENLNYITYAEINFNHSQN